MIHQLRILMLALLFTALALSGCYNSGEEKNSKISLLSLLFPESYSAPGNYSALGSGSALGSALGLYDESFNNGGSGANGPILSVAILGDGKILISGKFTTYNGIDVPARIIRLNSDGSRDPGFNNGGSGANEAILSIAIQGDGKILIGGAFTAYNGVDVPARIIRLNANGAVDPGFNTGGKGANSNINFIAIQGDGKILTGGYFTMYNGIDVPDGIIRLNADGTVDHGFNTGGSGMNGSVNSIAVQKNGGILIGGYFTTYNGVDVPDCIIRLNANGTVYPGFNTGGSGANDGISSIAVQGDGKILIGGNFTTYNEIDVPDRIIRLNADGTRDPWFSNGGSGANGTICSIAVQRNGMIFIGGQFTTYHDIDVPDGIIRLYSDGAMDSGFNDRGSGASSSINSIAIQGDGGILIGGYFTRYNGVDVPDRIIRLGPDGSRDIWFNKSGLGADNPIYSIAMQADGKILIGGAFTTYNGIDVPDRIIRLNADGTRDNGFNSGGSGVNGTFSFISSIVVQGDGKILIGGYFPTYNGVDVPDGIIRLNANGTVDPGFNNGGPGVNGVLGRISSIVVQGDGKILIGGYFTAYNGVDVPDYIIRLNANGTVDPGFNNGGSGVIGFVNSIAVQGDGKILIGGYFTTYNGVDVPDCIIRLNANGTVDLGFNNGGAGVNGANNSIFSIAVQGDGKILIGGEFTLYNGINVPAHIIRLNADGTRDPGFNNGGSGANNDICSIVVQGDGKILISGKFTTYNGADVPDYIIRLNADGTRDPGFNTGGSGANNNIWSIAVQGDGKILIGGEFITYNGVNVSAGIIRLNADGAGDTGFNNGRSGANNIIYSSAIQRDGKILIGGNFTLYNGIDVPDRIIRLNADGTVDPGFNNGGSGANSSIFSIAVQGDGKILIGGYFTTYNGVNVPDGIIRLNADGTVDSGFNNGGSGANSGIMSITVQGDGKILIGGYFITYNGVNVPDGIIRLNADGTVDPGFNNGGSGTNGRYIFSIAVQGDGNILIGGNFTTYNGIDVPDGIIRLNTDGTVDTEFNNGGSGANSTIYSTAVQGDGKILIGGNFTTYNGIDVPDRIIRLR